MNNFINALRQHTAYGDNKQPQPWLNWVVDELVEALSAYELESGHQKMNSLEEALQHQLA